MINSQIQILAQAESYLLSVTPEQYQEIKSPQFISSSGQHLRHVLDHYVAMIRGLKVGCIDYDKRSRGGYVESDIEAARNLILEIKSWLLVLTDQLLTKPLMLSTEVCIEEKRVITMTTSLARELVFASSHAIHHFAMMAQISKAQNIAIPDNFGLAPATATFMREQSCAR
ncbi:hypothetical protein CW745_10755 [Psychromonas sp. psych-6C06]|uniref:hypothetical protein n=1 Tax=Psychromonas sp. psych-6C06 TaxID=2058089 RepID=UPI000C32F0C9|nr:hypothetical protein [Psychromonas sp. psych-6C06]PKF61786.1 hypothetical protein CW745_10755 [Psychromonas sp. psych-6C06]